MLAGVLVEVDCSVCVAAEKWDDVVVRAGLAWREERTVRSFSGGMLEVLEVMAGGVKEEYVDYVDNESTWRVPS